MPFVLIILITLHGHLLDGHGSKHARWQRRTLRFDCTMEITFIVFPFTILKLFLKVLILLIIVAVFCLAVDTSTPRPL